MPKRKKQSEYGDIGSISSGTMLPEDLIPAFAYELKRLARRGTGHGKLARDAERALERSGSSTDLAEFVDELMAALNEYAPPYFYFGAHPGDGAYYGFWLSEDFQMEFEESGGWILDDGEKHAEPMPDDYEGEVLSINDHGNCSLHVVTGKGKRRKWREIWSVV